MLVIPAPSYSLAQAAWIPRLTIWRDDGLTQRREGEPCESWAAANTPRLFVAPLAHELILGHRLPPVVSNSAVSLSLPGDELSYLGQKQLQRLREGSHCRTSPHRPNSGC